jgi:hypothetical protein
MKNLSLLIAVIICVSIFIPVIASSRCNTPDKTMFSIHGNYSSPSGDFNDEYGNSFGGGGITYSTGGLISGDIEFSRYVFEGENYKDDMTIDYLGVGLSFDGSHKIVRIGIGMYFPDKGSSRPGINAGLGMGHVIYKSKERDKRIYFNYSGNYHYIFDGGTDFFEIRAGLTFELLVPRERRHPPPPPPSIINKQEDL